MRSAGCPCALFRSLRRYLVPPYSRAYYYRVGAIRPEGIGVPRTVKLSQRFYDKFGHDLVDEMVNWFNETDTTYRAELRELNDLNFARFDAKLEQRLAEVRAELQTEIRTRTADLGANLIKWMFIFWMGQAGLTVGLVLLVGRR